MENNELNNYIVNSLNVINQEIQLQDKRTLLLFSYMYNEYDNMMNKISYISYHINNINDKINSINTHNENLDIRIGKIDKKLLNIITGINNSKLNQIKVDDNSLEEEKSWIEKCWNSVKSFFIKIYNSIYNIIFKRKLKKQQKLEEEEKIKNENEKIMKQKQIIKNILSNTNNGYKAKQ